MKQLAIAVILLGLLGMVLWSRLGVYQLEVFTPGRPQAPLILPLSGGDGFSVWFFHSYDRAFFQENYEIDARGRIVLKDMTFASHLGGAGFAYPNFALRPDGVGELREIDEIRKQVEFMMGSRDLANHTLLWRGERITLADHFAAGEIIIIRVTEKPRWQVLFPSLNEKTERRL